MKIKSVYRDLQNIWYAVLKFFTRVLALWPISETWNMSKKIKKVEDFLSALCHMSIRGEAYDCAI